MKRAIGKWLAVILAASLGTAAPGLAANATLMARPPATALGAPEKRSGVLGLAGGAYAYIPKGLDGQPAALLVAFYGAGGQANDVLTAYRDYADANHFVLLIPVSAKGTWDMIEDLKKRLGAEMNVQPRFGKDLKSLDLALTDAFAKIAVDPARIGAVGFSDGATYALTVGMANPQIFKSVTAFSPGPAFLSNYDKDQRIFISHGDNDNVLPFDNTRGLVARLRVKQVPVTFVKFAGKHEVPKAVRDQGIAIFLGK